METEEPLKILRDILGDIQKIHYNRRDGYNILVELLADFQGIMVTEKYDDLAYDLEDKLREYRIAAKKNPWDWLGELYETEELGSFRSGQFFTPKNICDFMSQMTMNAAGNMKPTDPLVTVLEPAMGTGRMLMSASNQFPDAPLYFFGIEINLWLYRTSLVNLHMLSNHCYKIICADTLRLDTDNGVMSDCWKEANKWNPPDMTKYQWKAKPRTSKTQKNLLGSMALDEPKLKEAKKKKKDTEEDKQGSLGIITNRY